MASRPERGGTPHQHEQGPPDGLGLGDLLGRALAWFVVAGCGLLLLDGVLALTGMGSFGDANGWLALVGPGWLLLDEFRAHRGVAGRVSIAVTALTASATLGMLADVLATGAPTLVRGGCGALVTTLVYPLVWCYGIRWLTRPG